MERSQEGRKRWPNKALNRNADSRPQALTRTLGVVGIPLANCSEKRCRNEYDGTDLHIVTWYKARPGRHSLGIHPRLIFPPSVASTEPARTRINMPSTEQVGTPGKANAIIGGVPIVRIPSIFLIKHSFRVDPNNLLILSLNEYFLLILQLHYFDFLSRGRGQVVRLLFEDAGIAYTDVRYTFGEHAELKSTHPVLSQNPTKSMPIIELGGKLLTQSYSILRHFARVLGEYDGKTEEEKYQTDVICDIVADCKSSVQHCDLSWMKKLDEPLSSGGTRVWRELTACLYALYYRAHPFPRCILLREQIHRPPKAPTNFPTPIPPRDRAASQHKPPLRSRTVCHRQHHHLRRLRGVSDIT